LVEKMKEMYGYDESKVPEAVGGSWGGGLLENL
jgi:hypothetical protein